MKKFLNITILLICIGTVSFSANGTLLIASEQAHEKNSLGVQIDGVLTSILFSAHNDASGVSEVTGDHREINRIRVDTSELSIDANVNKIIDTHFLLKYEAEQNNDFELIEANVTFFKNNHIELNIGRQYLPFGVEGNLFNSDVLPYEIAEINKPALTADYFHKPFDLTIYAFESSNGNTPIIGGGRLNVNIVKNDASLRIGFDFIESILETTLYQEYLAEERLTEAYRQSGYLNKSMPGYGFHFELSKGNMTILANSIFSLGKLKYRNTTSNQQIEPPKAYLFEVDYKSVLLATNVNYIISLQGSYDGKNIGITSNRYVAATVFKPTEHVNVTTLWNYENAYLADNQKTGSQFFSLEFTLLL